MRHGDGKPYTMGAYRTIEGVKNKLNDIISLEIERKRPFFVDNDFFENKYSFGGSKLFYLCVLEREVKDWHVYSDVSDSNKANNLTFLCNF